ncbi:unnamed protein product [Ceratitis capitata]|uniref:(Mediterranean fruit fly) hypothetical protein n=1 Tax=Ceratitis capitata TaxID=7213 RepID=A0A811U2J5_CERCA|nr:unnamed protein product [Ceratitis capitata]
MKTEWSSSGLNAIQDTYKLDTSSVARGMLNGIQYSTEMSSDDVLSWVGNLMLITTITIQFCNVERALTMTNELLELTPDHERARGNKVFYEKEIAELQAERQVKGDDAARAHQCQIYRFAKGDPSIIPLTSVKSYECCVVETEAYPADLRPMRCRYVHNKYPSDDCAAQTRRSLSGPYMLSIMMMYDNEIELVKKMARPRFRRATVHKRGYGELETLIIA